MQKYDRECTMKILTLLCCSALLITGLAGCEKPKELDFNKTEPIQTSMVTAIPAEDTLKIAVGAMITPREGFAYYRHFLDYIGRKLGADVEFVDKQSYEEINNLLRTGEIDCAFVCSGPFVDGKKEFGLDALVAPRAYGKTVYYSYIIVPADSPVSTFEDLQGKTFAFADPQSNSGTLVPTYMLARRNTTPDAFFQKYIFTYAHDKSIMAVAQKVVDGAAVDSLIWEYADRTNPIYTSKTRIILKSPPYGIPPVVTRPGLAPVLRDKLRKIFLHAHEDDEGKRLLAGMMIEKFVPVDDTLYDSVREMKTWVAQRKNGN
jgi:phosphonate transport system substrate-binding protein